MSPCLDVLLVSSSPGNRQWIRNWLRSNPELQVIGAASTETEALILSVRRAPDMALVDLTDPTLIDPQLISSLRSCVPGMAVFAIACGDTPERQALDAGAQAVLPGAMIPANMEQRPLPQFGAGPTYRQTAFPNREVGYDV